MNVVSTITCPFCDDSSFGSKGNRVVVLGNYEIGITIIEYQCPACHGSRLILESQVETLREIVNLSDKEQTDMYYHKTDRKFRLSDLLWGIPAAIGGGFLFLFVGFTQTAAYAMSNDYSYALLALVVAVFCFAISSQIRRYLWKST